jgi:CBS domain-containing protein
MPHPKIEEVLQGQRLLHLAPGMTVRQAAREMAARHVGTVVVADQEGRLDGIFTERDLLERIVAAGLDPDTTPLAEVMTRDLQTITPDSTLREALWLMERHGIRHLPVMDNGSVVGIVSLRDLIGKEVAEVEHERVIADQITERLR